jgi:hypothetical protein
MFITIACAPLHYSFNSSNCYNSNLLNNDIQDIIFFFIMMRLGFTFPVSYLVRLCLLSNTPLALPTQEKNINLLQLLVFISHIPKYIQILFPPPPLGNVFVTLFIKIFSILFLIFRRHRGKANARVVCTRTFWQNMSIWKNRTNRTS